MSRLSRETKREAQQDAEPAEPVEVRVTGGAATVDGVPLFPAPGEEPQQTVLNHLQRLARAGGRPVLATVHDTRIGFVVSLRVNLDGSSSFTGDPVRMAVPAEPNAAVPVRPEAPERRPQEDRPSAGLRVVEEPAIAQAPSAFPPHALPDPVALGTVRPPTGVFGPPPAMGGTFAPAAVPAQAVSGPQSVSGPEARPEPRPEPLISPEAVRALDPDPRHTPARGFDAVAEEVLGDEPVTVTVEGAALLTESVARINEAVRTGRIERAAELAEQTVAEAAAAFGEGHTEVLHLRGLTAYIAYLAGDPERAFHLSLELARQHRQAGDGEGAYGNVRSAATAWRAVRDPEYGLRLGRDLIDLWSGLTTEEGPAADDVEELDSARARMTRLTERARRAAENA
ncbi:tetratricopeptide repeat protein [Streptomyces arenae]|uniref:tetratricopeptide repeat protein n=1 Tax=Streptomyces arenae TaxID=29301 RepID=UPI00265893E6|nr:tetratricopeptide repeat protein [Streptomyces arenae]MCG7202866.1 tetratricopeptide repeat protein [Streptomyces arenae]